MNDIHDLELALVDPCVPVVIRFQLAQWFWNSQFVYHGNLQLILGRILEVMSTVVFMCQVRMSCIPCIDSVSSHFCRCDAIELLFDVRKYRSLYCSSSISDRPGNVVVRLNEELDMNCFVPSYTCDASCAAAAP